MYYIGIDLGTSSVKLLLVDEHGRIHRTIAKEYPLSFPHDGWSEQNPEDWWNAVILGLNELTDGLEPGSVRGIGCGCQMHGLVMMDENNNIIRPCILWNDGRTSKETDWLNEEIGREKLSALTANIAFAGFTAPKLLWVKANEPENYSRIRSICLPKDYINFRLTGVHCSDYSDASGTLLLDVEHKCWSEEMCRICDVDQAWLPDLYESYETVGTVNCAELPFLQGVKVAAGAGDNAAAAIGTDTIEDGRCNISLGTSGTIFIANDTFKVDTNNGLHSFAHASGKYHLMGCMLSAASSNKWFMEDILGTADYEAVQKEIRDENLGHNPVFYLPYLMGERSPINDASARACFIGMNMATTRADMVQAVFEGVAFAIRDSLEVAQSLGITVERSGLCGGGAKSRLWRRIMCNVLNMKIDIPVTEEGPGYGGAMLAMVADGIYSTPAECAHALCSVRETIDPEPALAEQYSRRYQIFRKLYPALKDTFKEMKEDK